MNQIYFRSTYRKFFLLGIPLVIFGIITLSLMNERHLPEISFYQNECRLDHFEEKLEDIENILNHITSYPNCK